MAWYINFTPGQMIASAVVVPIVGIILLGLRLYSRQKRVKQYNTDDWLIVGATFFLLGMGVSILYGVANKGVGYVLPHDKAQAALDTIVSRKVLWSTEWIQTLCLGCIKLSFVFFYRRIFALKPAFNYISILFIIILIVWTLGFFLAFMLQCPGHPTAIWTVLPAPIHYARCWSTWQFVRVWVWSDVGTDVVLIVMPIPFIFNLSMSLKRKLAVTGAFLLGALALGGSIMRAVEFMIIQKINDGSGFDKMMLTTNTIFWCFIEALLAIIAVNLPVIYSGFRHIGAEPFMAKVRSYVSLASSAKSRNDTSQRTGSEGDVEPGKLPTVVNISDLRSLSASTNVSYREDHRNQSQTVTHEV